MIDEIQKESIDCSGDKQTNTREIVLRTTIMDMTSSHWEPIPNAYEQFIITTLVLH